MDGDDHIVAHVGVAWRIASRYSIAYNFPLDDLVSVASEGLIRAARAFEPSRDRLFWGYAKHRVQGMVMDTIRKAARRNELIPMVSIDNTMTLEMRVPDPLFWRNVWRVLDRMDTERRTLTHERHANWHSPSRRVVFRMYYLEDFTLAEIGACFNCSESRVAQIHREALVRLAEQFRGPDPSPRR